MKQMISLAAILIASSASAQTLPGIPVTMNMPNDTSFARSVEGYSLQANTDTPTMRKQKLARAVALREEATSLLQQDGGTLTPEHQAYVQRRAKAILSYSR